MIPGSADGIGPTSRLALVGVAAIELGPDGRPVTEFTAELATVDVYRENDSAYLKLLFRNATAYNSEEGALVSVPQAEPEAIDLGKGIRLKPKDLDLRGLIRVWRDVEHYHAVAEPRARAIAALGAVDCWSCIAERLESDGAVRLVDANGRRAFEVRNARVEGEKLVARKGATLELVELDRGSAGRRAEVSEAILRPDPRAREGELAFELVVSGDRAVAQTVDTRGNTNGRWPPRLTSLMPSACAITDRSARSVDELSAEASALASNGASTGAMNGADAQVNPILRAQTNAISATNAMNESVRVVRADIVARIVQRINQSLCAPLMLILGAVLAIRLRGSNPLQVYLLAFIPSIVAVLLISGGEQMLRESTSVLGIFIATSGNIGLASMILIAYRQVARN